MVADTSISVSCDFNYCQLVIPPLVCIVPSTSPCVNMHPSQIISVQKALVRLPRSALPSLRTGGKILLFYHSFCLLCLGQAFLQWQGQGFVECFCRLCRIAR